MIRILPPAKSGSLDKLAESWAATGGPLTSLAAVIIDGEFGEAQALSLSEIRTYLQGGGSWLAGATSIGALRAVECRNIGMIGLGRIYRDYLTGRRVRDSDVAVPTENGVDAIGPAACDVQALPRAIQSQLNFSVSKEFSRRHLRCLLSGQKLRTHR